MSDGPRVLSIVPARGGSKGVPGKNLRPLRGRPLVAYAVRAARLALPAGDVVISTDSEAIAAAAVAFGAECPFLRPPPLATDASPVLDTVRHTLDRLAALGRVYDLVCLVQPTTPLRELSDIREPVSMLLARLDAHSAVTLCEVTDAHPARLRRIEDGLVTQFLDAGGDGELQNRQAHAARPAYRRCGACYVTRVETVQAGSLYGARCLPHVIPSWRSVSIDDEVDLALVETLLEREPFAGRLAHLDAWFAESA